ncbi:MAG: ImmA/IrrE family metallo-endopeptidase [Clostridia bacterium]|nr:ImmA/IrrE family metallo-endopeptidase [Clostridia bacterium]
MSTEELIALAVKRGIIVDYFRISGRALALDLDGTYYIALNPELKDPELKEALAHELGHCFTRGFYSIRTPFAVRDWIEETAKRWAYKMLLPLDKVQELIKNGHDCYWRIAYEMELTEDFVKNAIEYYRSQGWLQ